MHPHRSRRKPNQQRSKKFQIFPLKADERLFCTFSLFALKIFFQQWPYFSFRRQWMCGGIWGGGTIWSLERFSWTQIEKWPLSLRTCCAHRSGTMKCDTGWRKTQRRRKKTFKHLGRTCQWELQWEPWWALVNIGKQWKTLVNISEYWWSVVNLWKHW